MSEYLGTIIVAAIIVLMVFFIVRGMVKDRKKGQTHMWWRLFELSWRM
ncbi:MAG: FeoB-associated Cys-rich membrane protein [Coprococcus sp.]